jgi:dienelactone hydrolase
VLLTPLQLHREVDMSLDGFEVAPFEHEGVLRPVYRRGNGPGVVIMHEIPGITPEVAGFARRVADAGFSVVMPSLFGTPGQEFSNGYVAGQMARACISREFHVLARRASSPITHYLRALARHTHAECGGPGVGAVGMCLTGNFALALMLDEAVMAPVMSQPSLPFGISRSHREAIHISDEDLEVVKLRAQRGCGVLGLRFTNDPLVPVDRFETLRRELGNGFEGIEIDSSKGNPYGIPAMAHSVLTKDLVDEDGHPTREALDRVLGLFRERLLGS